MVTVVTRVRAVFAENTGIGGAGAAGVCVLPSVGVRGFCDKLNTTIIFLIKNLHQSGGFPVECALQLDEGTLPFPFDFEQPMHSLSLTIGVTLSCGIFLQRQFTQHWEIYVL